MRRNDCVTIAAQSSHPIGSPMSQRECAGFNWPPLSIPAEEPVSISPLAVSRAGCRSFNVRHCDKVSPKPLPFPVDNLHFALRASNAYLSACPNSFALGVGQAASIFASVARLVCNILPVFLLWNFDPTLSKSSLISPALP